MNFVAQMTERFGSAWKIDEPMAKHVNFRIGGPAKYFVEVKTGQDVADAVRIATEAGVPYFALGGGSNTLVSDAGYEGLVIKLANRAIVIEGARVTADAGAISAAMARATADKGLRGFEWGISLPGTIGGAVRGNAGCFGGETRDSLESVRVLHDGQIQILQRDELHFGYRHSIFKDDARRNDIILDATFVLTPGDRAEAMAQLDKNLAGRKASQPLGSSSAGCMFKNVEFANEVDIAMLTKRAPVPPDMLARKRIAAGWIIDRLDLKGTRVGDAEVSDTHGNFLVNKGAATADHIMQLIAMIKSRVRNEAGVQLQEEVQILGF